MAKPKKRRVNSRDYETAQAEADLKFGPEISTVNSLIGQAQQQYGQDVLGAKRDARSAILNARAADPVIRDIYKDSTKTADVAQQDVQRAFGALGGAADVFRAATAREQGGRVGRISEAQASARKGLVDRKLNAVATRTHALGQAKGAYDTNLKTLSDRLSEISGQSNAQVVSTIGRLAKERAERAKDKTIARIGAGEKAADRASREKIAADKLAASEKAKKDKAKGKGKETRATADQQLQLKNEVAKAYGVAKANRSQPRSAVAATMIKGQSPPKGGGAPAVPSFSQMAATIALDMAYDGHISRSNAKELHRLGYKVSDFAALGPSATSYSKWKAANKRKNQDAHIDRFGP